MTTTLRPLDIRRRLGRNTWLPPEPFGPDGWRFQTRLRLPARPTKPDREILVTAADVDGIEWVHASIARPGRTPTYDDLVELHHGVYGDTWAYQVFAPPQAHVNLHPYALHLWARADGQPILPNFGRHGTI